MKTVRVVAAVIADGNRYLCMQRHRSNHTYDSERWEFPGGKVEEGESDEQALRREIHEEMDWDIHVDRHLCSVMHDYPDFTIDLEAYLCSPGQGHFTMLEHLDYQWLTPQQMSGLSWTAADSKIAEQLLRISKQQTGL